MSLDPYRACECGSGRKWKFCCRLTAVDELEQDFALGQRNLADYEREQRQRQAELDNSTRAALQSPSDDTESA